MCLDPKNHFGAESELRAHEVGECIDALRLPDVHCLSVKISTLYSQISPLARSHTISKVADRLETGVEGSSGGREIRLVAGHSCIL